MDEVRSTHALRRSAGTALLAIAIAFHLLLVLRSAWVTDDAYITLRTVDNAVHGLGLVWNPGERVQTYTHPLWMLCLLAGYAITREAFLTTIAVSVLVHALSLGLLCRVARDRAIAATVILALCASRGFVDFATSGLENPLTHLLLFAYVGAIPGALRTRRLARPALALGLLACNRMDSVLLVAPSLAVLALGTMRRGVPARRVLRDLALGLSPFVAWEAFSLVYYGFLFPNTAYAKLAGAMPTAETLQHGAVYLVAHLREDPPTLLFAIVGIAVALRGRDGATKALGLGLLLHLVYLVRIGGDFMLGRFLTPEVALAAAVLVADERLLAGAYAKQALLGAAAVLGLPFLASRIGVGSNLLPTPSGLAGGVADERSYYASHASLAAYERLFSLPDHEWAQRGAEERLRRGDAGGTVVQAMVGYYGFAAGPRIHLIDPYAITDPLLARLPALRVVGWRTGHLWRVVPEGYVDTVERARRGERFRCTIAEPGICALEEALQTVVRGPLFRWERLRAILWLNGGAWRDAIVTSHFRYPGQVRVRAERLLRRCADGTAWNAAENVAYNDSGIDVVLGGWRTDAAFTIGLDTDEVARVFFSLRGRIVGESRIHAVPGGGIRPRRLQVPRSARRAGYDTIRVLPIGGDGSRALAYLLPP